MTRVQIATGPSGYLLKELKKDDPFLKGLGEGLMVSDAQDRDKCFYPVVEQAKRRKRQRSRKRP